MKDDEMKRYILSQCDEVGDCMIWRGLVDGGGTPMMRRNQKQTDSVRRVLARALGQDPTGLMATTTCGDKLCMCPKHLALWTRKELQARSMKKVSGNVTLSLAARNSRKWKLTMDDARAIRASESSVSELAASYGVSRRAIYEVLRQDSWKDYSNPFAGLIAANDAQRSKA